MTRFLALAIPVFTCAMLAAPARADDPSRKLTAEERRELETKHREVYIAGGQAYRAGKYQDASTSWQESLKVARQLYNTTEFPDGHPDLAQSLNNLAVLYWTLGNLRDAEPLFKDALEMKNRLYKGQDHTDLAVSLNNLAFLYKAQGKLGAAESLLKDALEMTKRLVKGQDHTDFANSLNNLAGLCWDQGKLGVAEPLFKDALEMRKRLFKGQDHADLSHSLNNLAGLYRAQGNLRDAEPLMKDALEMRKRLFKGQDHPDIARSLNDLAFVYRDQGKLSDVEPLFKDALDMRKRLFKGQDHPDLAISLNNLAGLYQTQGKTTAAEPLMKDALEMHKRLSKGQDHTYLASSLNNLAFLYRAQGKLDAAETLFKDALAIYRRLAVAFAQDKTEGETLTLLARQPLTRDAYLSATRGHESDPASVYAQVWADKGYIARAYERRLLQARAAVTDPKAARALAELTDARHRRAELLLTPASKDPATLAQRKRDIATCEVRIEENTRGLKVLLPASARADKLAAAIPSDLQQALPVDVAVVDFLRFVHFEYDKGKPGRAGETLTPRYLAFVVTKEQVAWVELDTTDTIEAAVNAWRTAITSGKEIPAAIPAKVRQLIWEKVRKELPADITTVYVCPDAALCQIPFAALPGDKPGTILLEDFAVATIPHAPFLLDKLWPQDERKHPPTSALVVGGVKYDAEIAPATPAPNAVVSRGDPLLKPGQKLGWGFLPNTEGEVNGFAAAAGRRKLTAVRLEGDRATTAAVLAALPRAKYAHFATHGFFADPSFRSVFDLDPKDYENRGGERVGKAALSPLVMTGLVFAGANRPATPGRGIVTGEQLIDLDLSGLELAVLSACETGLGDVAGGQGTFGLQRAFHYAGTTNVVCSLWKVPDESTAALMNLFYTNLWDKNLSPMESLRQAQLAVYRNPGKLSEWAKGFRGKFELVPGTGTEGDAVKPGADGKAHPVYWAAFTLSGPGR